MPPKTYSKTPKNVSSQENNPSILNLGTSEDQLLSSQVKSTNNFERNGSKKNTSESFKISRNSSVSSGLGGGSPRKRISPKKDSNLPKSVIKEKPSVSPAKGWGELEGFSELKDRISQELAENGEKSFEYLSEFPTLGEAVETPKANTLPSIEILNPPTNVQTLLHKNIDNSPSRKEKKGESLVSEEKIQEYSSHFPSLGAELNEAKEIETEFDPEILEAEKKLAVESENIEAVNIVSFLEHEDPSEKTSHKKDFDKKTHGDLLSLDLELKSENQEVMKKILDKNIHLRHTELAPPPKDDTWDKSVLDQNKVETYVPEEKVQEYETHFPALGEEPIAAKNVETEFSRDILKAEEKFAVEAENVEPVNIIIPKEEISEERTREISFTRGKEEQETRKQVRHIDPSDERLHIPIDEIPNELLLEPEEVKTPRNSEVDELEEFILRIPLELVPDFLEDEPGMVYSPTNKRIKFLGHFNIFADKSPNIPQSEIENLPRTFTEAFEQFELKELLSNIRISLESAPEFISEESMKPTNRRIKELGQISVWGDKSPNASQSEIAKQPQTFSDAIKIVMASTVEDIETKLASELEQEEQVLDFLNQGKENKYEGKTQRIKQDIQLQEINMNASLQQSWDIIQGIDDEAEKKSYEGYKIVKPNIGDVEENQRLLSKQQDDLIREEEDAEFGSYKAAGTKEKDTIRNDKVEIQDETIRKAPIEPDLQPIEEKIVTEEKDEGLNLRDVLSKDIKELEKAEGKESPLGGSKVGEKSSLEHIAEEPTLAFTNQSADLTLSSQRIDLIKEELNTILNSPKDSLFKQIDKNFQNIKDLERSQMYGAAINILKKSLDMLDARIAKHESFNIDQMNNYLIKINNELAHCYAQVSEFRESVGYARATLNLDSGNVKAIYYLGTGLNKIGDPLGGYNTLKDVRRLTPPTDEHEYFTMINIELQKFERKMEEGSRKQLQLESPLVKEIPLTKLPPGLTPQPKKTPSGKESGSSALSNIGIFAGTAGVSGAASWFITKDYLNLSEKKSLMYSLGIGALVGGISLAIFGSFKKEKSNK